MYPTYYWTVESSNGLLRVRNANQTAPMPIGVGQTLAEGAEVSTEPGGVGVLRFADGQKLALAGNSSVRIANYRFDATQHQFDRVHPAQYDSHSITAPSWNDLPCLPFAHPIQSPPTS